jgi:NAD(P)-dependent dehydrogenase (short-subunit alcohol dehydrogenase family)
MAYYSFLHLPSFGLPKSRRQKHPRGFTFFNRLVGFIQTCLLMLRKKNGGLARTLKRFRLVGNNKNHLHGLLYLPIQEATNMANEKKVALVTGSNRGIGFETARQLGQQGVSVVVTARTEREAADAASKLRSEGIEAEALALDVTKAADRAAAAEFIESRYGKLDILVNNAGVGPADGLIGLRASESTEEELQSIFNVNLFALVALTREFLPLLKKSEAGRIVNLASILGSLTLQAMDPSPIAPLRKFAYNASKAAVNVFTIHLSAELKDTNIKVNSVYPGWVKTALGSDAAPMSVPDGAKTTVAVALLGSDSPNGRFIHEINKELPW